MKANFILTSNNKDRPSPIWLRVYLSKNNYFKFSTGEKILHSEWDNDNKCPIGINSRGRKYDENI
jgi:hypothetical protein